MIQVIRVAEFEGFKKEQQVTGILRFKVEIVRNDRSSRS